MSIIIEGCDLSGKTTLAEDLNWPIMTREVGGRGRATLDNCMKLYLGYTIWVRWWMTEYVYGDIFRGSYLCSLLDIWKFKLLSDVYGAVLIHLLPSNAKLIDRHKKRQEERNLSELIKIKKGYLDLFEKYHECMPPIFYIEKLEKALRLHSILQKKAAKLLELGVTSWGTLETERIMFCGEKIPTNSRAIFPFAFRTNKGCGQYFFQALVATSITPNDVHIMNLWNKDDSLADFQAIFELLKPRKIIALGKKVSGMLTEHHVEHLGIPHPQHWKRFHYNDLIGYIRILQAAIG